MGDEYSRLFIELGVVEEAVLMLVAVGSLWVVAVVVCGFISILIPLFR